MLLAISVLALILAAIGPRLQTRAILLVVLPLAEVPGPIRVLIQSITVGFVVAPVPLVHVAVCVPELTLAVRPIVPPLSFVFAAIRPDLSAPARLDPILRCVASVNGLRGWRLHFVYHYEVQLSHENLEASLLLLGIRLVGLGVLCFPGCFLRVAILHAWRIRVLVFRLAIVACRGAVRDFI